jgi:hypothetical protein
VTDAFDGVDVTTIVPVRDLAGGGVGFEAAAGALTVAEGAAVVSERGDAAAGPPVCGATVPSLKLLAGAAGVVAAGDDGGGVPRATVASGACSRLPTT